MAIESNYSLQALSPEAQEAREKEAILNDVKLNEYLTSVGVRITNIYKSTNLVYIHGSAGTNPRQYMIETTNGSIPVNVIYLPKEGSRQICGPAQFKIEFPEISATLCQDDLKKPILWQMNV